MSAVTPSPSPRLVLAARQQWADPAMRAKMIEGLKAYWASRRTSKEKPAPRIPQAEVARQQWADPVMRAKMIRGLRAKWSHKKRDAPVVPLAPSLVDVPPATPAVDLEKYTRLVHKLAWKYAKRLPERALLEEADLAQEGFLTLVKALRSYKPGRSTFMTYAYISLVRRMADLTRTEWTRVGVMASVEAISTREDDSQEDPLDWLAVSDPTQSLVDVQVDLERGKCWEPVNARQAQELEQRLFALVGQ